MYWLVRAYCTFLPDPIFTGIISHRKPDIGHGGSIHTTEFILPTLHSRFLPPAWRTSCWILINTLLVYPHWILYWIINYQLTWLSSLSGLMTREALTKILLPYIHIFKTQNWNFEFKSYVLENMLTNSFLLSPNKWTSRRPG